MVEWLPSCLLPRQRETKCAKKKKTRGRLQQSKVSFPFADQAIVIHHIVLPHHQVFVLVLSTTVDVLDRAIVVFPDNYVEDVIIVCVDNFLRNIALPIIKVFGFKVPTLNSELIQNLRRHDQTFFCV